MVASRDVLGMLGTAIVLAASFGMLALVASGIISGVP
jgi:hypothetical protein